MPDTAQRVEPTQTVAQPRSRSWRIAGLIAAIGSFVSVFLSMMLSPEYVAGSVITPEQIDAGFAAERHLMIAFHIVTLASGLILVVFAAGLHGRLRRGAGSESLSPLVAFAGLLLVAAAQVFGTGLDTEFLFGVGDTAINLPSDIGMYSHWIATIPWLWVGGGLAALAVGAGSRASGLPRWIGVTSWVLGVVTVLVALSPLQYMAAGPGILWLLIVSVGLLLGDREGSTAS